jgi:hypothetical protein
MRGHEPLIALRRRGLKPGLVNIDLEPSPWRDWADWPEWTAVPQIEVLPSDSIRLLDLRFLVGLHVMLGGFDGARVWAMFDACKAAGAARVLGFEQTLTNGGQVVRTVLARDSLAEAVEA